uniref:Anion exchange protein n=1 Tax=Panagrellus redivivus TaxID=6233 RepID=A0A7E4V940_PANRE
MSVKDGHNSGDEHRSGDILKSISDRRLSKIPANSHNLFFYDDSESVPSSFTELDKYVNLNKLSKDPKDGHWEETSRWIKFQEVVDDGGKRWSKPHIPVVNANSLFQLKEFFFRGSAVHFDLKLENYEEIVENVLNDLVKTDHLSDLAKEKITTLLLRRLKEGVKHEKKIESSSESQVVIKRKGNKKLVKKLPTDAEATNIFVGHVNFLDKPFVAWVRLAEPVLFESLTEVPVPTRFLFFALAPRKGDVNALELGRAYGTLMTDELFRKIAYRTKTKTDLKIAVSEYIHNATVLPPCSLDPKLRIEPTLVATEDARKLKFKHLVTHVKEFEDDGPHHDHGNDPALQRTGKFAGGLIKDIKRKAKWYVSDFTDSLNLECVSTFCFMYFALLSPIVTFGGLLEEATDKRMAAMENLFSGAICGVLYHLFSGQPLTIIGSTGPVLVFETIVFDMCSAFGWDYLSFRSWINLWTAIYLMIITLTDMSSLVKYITRFTEESFASLIAFIFIYEAFAKSFKIKSTLRALDLKINGTDSCFCQSAEGLNVDLDDCAKGLGSYSGDGCYVLYDKFLMSIILVAGTFIIIMALKSMRSSGYFPTKMRAIGADFAVIISIAIMTSFDVLAGIDTPKLTMPSSFKPTWSGRTWFVPPFGPNPIHTAAIAAVPALLLTILIFLDQQITAVIVNRKEYKLKKGCGYHLDLFVLSILIVITGYLGVPIYVAATVLSINHVNSLKVQTEAAAPGEPQQFLGVREQRVTGIVTFILIGVSVFMTKLLCHIPMPVLYGVFLFMGINALGTLQFFERLCLMFMPMKYQPDTEYIRHVPIKTIHLFTMFQVVCLSLLWIVKSIKSISIAFPVMLILMIVVRKLMEHIFTPKHLSYLDDIMPPVCGSGSADHDSDRSSDAESLPLDRRLSVQYTPHYEKGHEAASLITKRMESLVEDD